MHRRDLLRRLGVAAGVAAAGGPLVSRALAGARPRAAAAPTVLRAPRSDDRPSILFCIGDDWGWPHTGALGDKVVRTPTFDRVAREGVLLPYTYCASPSCTPSRGSILTGQMFWRLEEGGNLWSTLPKKFQVYPDLLEAAGYHVGLMRKGWGPGDFKAGGWTRNPAGPTFKTFDEFFKSIPDGKPFCFWFGSLDPHRAYEPGSGAASGLRAEAVSVPPMLPDAPEVRQDILDYYFECERCDRDAGEMIAVLERAGRLDNTIVFMTGDNGWPFPRGKTNLYDHGCRQPMAVRWPARAKGGRAVEDFLSLSEIAPTVLEAAGVERPADMHARSFLDVLVSGKSGRVDPRRDRVVVGRERHHGGARPGCLGYPQRMMRTHEYLYIRNFLPERWPAGDPPGYEDCDGGPTKKFMTEHRQDPAVAPLFELCFGKRPAEELYDCRKDPGQLKNLAADPAYADARKRLAADLDAFLRETKDPRVVGGGEKFDEYPYRGSVGAPAKAKAPK
ncbi:MAG: sulfatase [Planctomycetes bacterium]|nr:sulfatase [Planctomycetota bacterium]